MCVYVHVCVRVNVCKGPYGNSVWRSPQQKEIKKSSKRVMNTDERSGRVLHSVTGLKGVMKRGKE